MHSESRIERAGLFRKRKVITIPDQRVKNAVMDDKLSIPLPTNATMQSVLKSSEIIYNLFGDLYDIPLFAYEDFQDCL